jgi:hypothetical protein
MLQTKNGSPSAAVFAYAGRAMRQWSRCDERAGFALPRIA